MIKIGDYNTIMSDHDKFNQIVYTPLSEAINILAERQKNPELILKVEKLLSNNIPKVLNNKNCGVLCRQIATPNHETKMFLSITKENDLNPLLFEFIEDKFCSNNNYKHSLGQLNILKDGFNNNDRCLEKINIIDFNSCGGQKLCDVKTLWGESLVDFHHKLFDNYNYDPRDLNFIDLSLWIKENGHKPIDYYTNFLLLFVCHGILFENFLVSEDKEGEFTKSIVLSAIENVINLTGVKPIIVPIPPMDMENEDLWYQHLPIIKNNIPKI